MAQKSETELLYKGLNGGPNLIANFSKTAFRSAKITVQASANLHQQMTEIYVIHDGNTAYINTSNMIDSLGVFTTFEANTDNASVYIYATSSESNANLSIFITSYADSIPSVESKMHLESIVATATSMDAFYPNSNVDYASALTSSLDKERQLTELNVRINKSIEYMETAEFLAKSSAQKAEYINDLANNINNISDDLNTAVDNDIKAFNQYTTDIESMAVAATLNGQYQNPVGRKVLNKVLKRDAKTLFQQNEPFPTSSIPAIPQGVPANVQALIDQRLAQLAAATPEKENNNQSSTFNPRDSR